MSLPPSSKRLCVGVVTGAHGVRGAVRVKTFTADPLDLDAYGALSDAEGRRTFRLKVAGLVKGVAIATIDGISDRDAAEAMKGLQLYVERDSLPAPEEDEFYHADLIGLEASTLDGKPLGRVTALYDFGAGDSVELTDASGRVTMVPFTKAAVPTVDLAAGKLLVDPPAGLFDKVAPPKPLDSQQALAEEMLAEETEPVEGQV